MRTFGPNDHFLAGAFLSGVSAVGLWILLLRVMNEPNLLVPLLIGASMLVGLFGSAWALQRHLKTPDLVMCALSGLMFGCGILTFIANVLGWGNVP